MSNTGLFSEFTGVSAKQWKQKIQVDLKGADYNNTLVWESLEGINVKPFYNQDDLKSIPTFSLPKNHDWSVAQVIYVGDEKKSNTKALTILEKGVESLIFTIPNETTDFEVLLSDLDMEKIELYFYFEFCSNDPTCFAEKFDESEPIPQSLVIHIAHFLVWIQPIALSFHFDFQFCQVLFFHLVR